MSFSSLTGIQGGSSLTCFGFLKKQQKTLSRFSMSIEDQLFTKDSYDTEDSSLSVSLNSIPSNEDWDCEEKPRDLSFELFRPDDIYDSLFIDNEGNAVISPRVVIPPRAIHIDTILQTVSTDSYEASPVPSPSAVQSSHYNGRTMESRYVSMPRSTPAAASKAIAALQRPRLESSNSGTSSESMSSFASPAAPFAPPLEEISIFVVSNPPPPLFS